MLILRNKISSSSFHLHILLRGESAIRGRRVLWHAVGYKTIKPPSRKTMSPSAFRRALTAVVGTPITYALIVSIPRVIFACIGRRNNSLQRTLALVCGDLTHLTRAAFIVARNKGVLNLRLHLYSLFAFLAPPSKLNTRDISHTHFSGLSVQIFRQKIF